MSNTNRATTPKSPRALARRLGVLISLAAWPYRLGESTASPGSALPPAAPSCLCRGRARPARSWVPPALSSDRRPDAFRRAGVEGPWQGLSITGDHWNEQRFPIRTQFSKTEGTKMMADAIALPQNPPISVSSNPPPISRRSPLAVSASPATPRKKYQPLAQIPPLDLPNRIRPLAISSALAISNIFGLC